jgi:hypothetical protein
MIKIVTVAAIAALALTAAVMPQPAQARNGVNGAIAAGVVGGLAVGAIVGSQANSGYYGGPSYYDNGYQPVYGACHTERQEFEDGYGRIRVRRVRVCD